MVHRGVVSGRDLEIKGNQWNTANIDLAAYKGQNVQPHQWNHGNYMAR
jgi:hypothetical protein